MNSEAVIWTEGKTDWQHLKRACQVLHFTPRLAFQETGPDLGDDQLLKQCVALARVPQPCPTIFIFDRDKDDIVCRVEDPVQGYKAWGNNVYSFAIPIAPHRVAQSGICIELYYTDGELRTPDSAGRRLFLSSEFNPASGRHISDSRLSIGQKGKLPPAGKSDRIRVVDSEVYDEQHQNVAMSKADFASNVLIGKGPFAEFRFEGFRAIFATVQNILDQSLEQIDLPFGDLDSFQKGLEKLDRPHQLGAVVKAGICACKLALMTFAAATIRYYDAATVGQLGIDGKRLRPIRQVLAESLTTPSLTTLVKLARHCYHLVDDHAPAALRALRAVMAENPTLGPLGDVFDDLERLFPPDLRRGRTVNKRQVKKPVLEYVLPELAKYEGRTGEIEAAATDALQVTDPATWRAALSTLVDLFAPLRALPFRVRTIERVQSESDEFIVVLKTYRSGRVTEEEVIQEFADLTGDQLETYELLLAPEEGRESLDLSPFLSIKRDRLHYYNRTRAAGFDYCQVFNATCYITRTKRKFSQAALGATLASRQMLFWAQAVPSVSAAGVKANIPAHDPNAFIGRKQQIAKIIEEVIEIPNQNGLIYGPGGVGKTALLIELSRQLFEEGSLADTAFKNVIWASAKRDYYEPTRGEIETSSQQQFGSLDNILTAVLEFHDFENAEEYEYDEKKWFVIEFLREESTLLILDNFETIPNREQEEITRFFGLEVKRALRDKPDYFKVVLSSREVIPIGFHRISLKGLDKRESKQLMQRLDEPYQQSGQQPLTEEQKDALYEATRGIPLIIKHCYGQIYEYSRPVDLVLRNLFTAGSTVVEFSFQEIFDLLKRDDLHMRMLLLLELIGRPLLLRQIADILDVPEADISRRIGESVNFQCVIRSSAGTYDKYAVNEDVRFVTKGLVHEHISLVAAIKRQIARLTIEKRLDYTKEEFDCLIAFQDHLAQGEYVHAEDYIKARLQEFPNSVLLNLHYAKYLKEVKRRTVHAIERLEEIRVRSGNDPEVLRLLMSYYAELDHFEQAHTYARELEGIAAENQDINLELANFYTQWSTALKMKVELDPLKEMVRQQKYKELADTAIAQLKRTIRKTHEYFYMFAQSYYNKWDYDSALGYIEPAISSLPRNSYLSGPYHRLKNEILKKRAYYAKGHEASRARAFHG